jgi:hypothetical protein
LSGSPGGTTAIPFPPPQQPPAAGGEGWIGSVGQGDLHLGQGGEGGEGGGGAAPVAGNCQAKEGRPAASNPAARSLLLLKDPPTHGVVAAAAAAATRGGWRLGRGGVRGRRMRSRCWFNRRIWRLAGCYPHPRAQKLHHQPLPRRSAPARGPEPPKQRLHRHRSIRCREALQGPSQRRGHIRWTGRRRR